MPTLDAALIKLDGTLNKERLGANAIVGVSMAVAARDRGGGDEPSGTRSHRLMSRPGCRSRTSTSSTVARTRPNALEFQEFMLAPLGAPSLAEAVRAGAEIYAVVRSVSYSTGASAQASGDEGGSPRRSPLPRTCSICSSARSKTPATNRACRRGNRARSGGERVLPRRAYHVNGETLSSDEMIERYAKMIERFPIWSLEDGLAEDDRAGWERLTARLGERIQLVGDDLLVTNPAIIAEAIDHRFANAALIKPNQIGTVTETLEAMRVVARPAGHRWCRIARARRWTASSRIWRSDRAAARSRAAHRPVVSGREVQPVDRDRGGGVLGLRAGALRPDPRAVGRDLTVARVGLPDSCR